MRSEQSRQMYRRRQLLEVICQLRFPDILKIESTAPAEFQDQIRAEYPQYQKKVEQLPPQIVNGKPVPQGTVNNYQFISEDGQWKISLTRSFIALSTHGYTRWEDFAKRLDRVLAALIQLYQPAYFTRVGLRYINAIDREALKLDDCLWRELIQPGYLGLLADEDAQESAFSKCEQNASLLLPGGAKSNVKAGPGTLRKVNNRTKESSETRVYMLDLDVYMDGKTPLGQTAPALNIVHGNADSLFRGAITDTLADAMEPEEP